MPHRVLLIIGIFVAACIVGPALDQIHVVGGALWYAHPWLLGQAWWVGPQFGIAFAIICSVTLAVQHYLGTRTPAPTPRPRIAQQAAWFLVAYLATGMLWDRPWLLTALLAGGLVVRLFTVRPDTASVRTIVFLALAGSTYEALVSSIPGTFDYSITAHLPVPIWLPLLYAHGAPLLRTFSKNATAAVTRRTSGGELDSTGDVIENDALTSTWISPEGTRNAS